MQGLLWQQIKKLNDLISTGKFRKDLYYRLSTHEVEISPLKSRKDDLPLLIDFFLDMASKEMGKKRPTPPPELFSLLETYDFPGNIRELKSMIFDAVSMHKRGILSLTSFKAATGKNKIPTSLVGDNFHIIFGNRLPTLKITTELLIKEAIKRSKGNQALAAHLLGISSAALSKRLTRGRDRYK
ncbi:Transcriptional regulatory protein ZraR [subsurface metagenome]